MITINGLSCPTVADAAVFFGVHPKTVRAYVQRGLIPAPPTVYYGIREIAIFPEEYLDVAQQRLYEYRTARLADRAIDRLGVEQDVLLLNDDGSISYVTATLGPNGALQVTAEDIRAVLVAGAMRTAKGRRADLGQLFEDLLNMRGLREQDIQEFLEENPEFLLGTEYDAAIPQVVLPVGEGRSLRPDFILRPLAGVTWDARIIELKLPAQQLLREQPRHHRAMYGAVHDGVSQLRSYQRYFEDEIRRTDFARRMGFSVRRPKLALVLGRSCDLPQREALLDAMEDVAPVDILSYDDLILRYRRLRDSRRTRRGE